MRQGSETLEGRCALLAATMMSAAVYASGINTLASIYAIVVSAFATRGWSLKILRLLAPLLALGVIAAIISVDALRLTLGFAAFISVGAIVLRCGTSEIAGALIYFRVPERVVSVIAIALTVVELIARDARNVFEVQNSKLAAFKALAATAFLRSVGLSEALYSKCFSFRAVYIIREPSDRDILLLAAGLAELLATLAPST